MKTRTSKIGTALLLGLALAPLLTSCATLVNGTKQSIGIASNPAHADIWLDNAYVGHTPMVVQMSRNNQHIVTLSLEGFEPYQIIFSKRVSGWVFGNIIFGGLIGLAVDAFSGGIFVLTPEQVRAELCRSDSCMRCSKKSADSYVTIVMSPDPSWKKVGNLKSLSDKGGSNHF